MGDCEERREIIGWISICGIVWKIGTIKLQTDDSVKNIKL